MGQSEHRKEVERYIVEGQWRRATDELRALWKDEPTSANAGFIVARYEQMRPHLSLTSCRVAFLRSFTLEPAIPSMRAAALNAGIDTTVHIGAFNSYAQEILDPASDLYKFAPDVAILAVQTRDIAPELWFEYADLSAEQLKTVEQRVAGEFKSWFDAFRASTKASLIVHTLETPARSSNGTLDSQSGNGQADSIQRVNRLIREAAHNQTGIYCLDYDALVSRFGKSRWHDDRKWLTARMPFSAESLPVMAAEWVRHLYPIVGKLYKVLVTDLDNTLWGGVVGEDGLDGIQVGPEYPGSIYLGLQRAILDLSRRGVILAVCSKNNPEEAMQALDTRPEMLLRSSQFSALRMNWTDKATNIREIAEELNLGLDSIAFLDDNEVEREQVRNALPEVHVISLPKDPSGFAGALRDCLGFERLQISSEDKQRAQLYVQQRQRAEFSKSVTSTADFYRSLQQEVEIVPATGGTIPRVAQLTQKTNQFNLTTRRYTEQEITAFIASPDSRVYSVRVKDRFGDNGITGAVILRFEDSIAEIDTFLLSCRVIGRTVETAIIAFLAEQCRSRGVKKLEGWFIPTKKNKPAESFYASHSFERVEEQEGRTRWSLPVATTEVKCPEWIQLNVSEGTSTSVYASA